MYKKQSILSIILILLLILGGCIKPEENKDHVLNNEEVSGFIVTQAKTKLIYNYIDDLEETTTFVMYLNAISQKDEAKEITYELKAVNALGDAQTYISNKKQTLPLTKQLVFNTNIGGNGFSEFFLKINNGKEYNFYEEAKTLSPYDFLGYPEEFKSDDLAIRINVEEDDEKYNLTFTIDSKQSIHLDLQTFLVSEERKIYSFLGVYGYEANLFPYIIENNYIYKEMNMLFLYFNITIYNFEGKKTELRASYKLDKILT